MVADLYSEAVASYRAGDYAAASRAMGLLSHYYSDACTPFHTAGPNVRKAYADYHRDYENAVKTVSHLKSDKTLLQLRDRKTVYDVRRKTIASAYVANRQLDTICDSWPAGGISNKTVRAATKVSLSEAVNGLADMIAAVPPGKGLAPQPAKFSTFKPYRRYVAKYKSACSVTRVVDSSGNPMRGVMVNFTWELASGKKTDVDYTDADGYATSWQATGSQPWYKPFHASSRVDTFGATLTSKQTWFMTTPRLEKGKAGFVSSMSNKYPTRGSYVTARAKAVSTSGKPVPNLRVKFVWKHSSQKIVTYATTDSKGIARSKRYIGNVQRGYKVYVVATTQAAGVNRQWTTNFTPK